MFKLQKTEIKPKSGTAPHKQFRSLLSSIFENLFANSSLISHQAILVAAFMYIAVSAWGQEARVSSTNAFGISVSFLNERTKQTTDKVASNVLRIVNKTSRQQTIIIQFSYPAMWRMMGMDKKSIVLEANDSVFIPVRVIPDKQSLGNTAYVINAMVSSRDVNVGNAIWNISIDKMSDWHVSLPQKKIYFQSEADSTSFEINFRNTGNSDEQLVLIFSPSPDITLTDYMGAALPVLSFSYLIPVGCDTTITFSARRKISEILPTESEFSEKEQRKQYSIKMQVRNERVQAGSKSWSGTVELVKVPETVRYRSNRYSILPVTMELNTYDLFSDRTYASFDIYGNSVLPKQQTLSYYYQSNFNTNYLNAKSFLGQFHFLGYQNKYFGAELGNVGASRSGSNLSGKGARANVSLFGNTISALYVRSPNFSEKAILEGVAFNHTLRTRFFTLDNYFQKSEQYLHKTSTELLSSDLSVRLFKTHLIKINGGYSQEVNKFNPASPYTLFGHQYSVRYNGSFKRFMIGGGYSYTSPSFSVLKGMSVISGNAAYNISKKHFIAANFNHFDYKPEVYQNGILLPNQPFTQRKQYSLRWNINSKTNVLIFNPSYQKYTSNQLNVETKGSEIEYRYNGSNVLKFYTSVFAGYTRALDLDVKDFFVSQIRASVAYHSFSANLRYFYGPYYSQEQLQFLRTQQNPQKLFASVYHDFWFAANRVLLKSNINYNYSSLFQRSMLSVRPELFYFAPHDFRFSIYGRYLLMGEGQTGFTDSLANLNQEMSYNTQWEIGLGIKKNINIPLTFDRFYDVEIVTFRDLNANGVKDNNEMGIGNMLIRIQLIPEDDDQRHQGQEDKAYEVITGSKGKGIFTRVPLGEYYINAFPVASTGSWFDGKTIRAHIDKNKTIYIPLNKGAKLSGGIMVDRDKYSRLLANINFANIRVTATDSAGRNFSTLTDAQGRFSLFLPNGRFVISMNEAAFGETFEFLQNSVPLTLTEEFENYNITFYLVEKSRELRVKKFDSDGKSLEPDRAPVRREGNDVPVLKTDTLQRDSMPQKNTKANSNAKDSPKDEVIEVISPSESGMVWRVQLFEEARELMSKSGFTSLPRKTGIFAIQTLGGYFYVTEVFSKASKAGKTLKKLQKKGYSQAKVVKYLDGQVVPF